MTRSFILESGGHVTRNETRYLLVEGEPATLVHEEHDPIPIPPGAYRVVRQREYEPRGWRTVAD